MTEPVPTGWRPKTSVAELNAAKARVAAAGGRIAGPPSYGNKLARPGVLVPHPDEQVALNLMIRQHALGWSWERIARTLDALEFAPRKGERWNRTSVREIVLNATGQRARTG